MTDPTSDPSHDPLRRWLSAQVEAATPATTAPFDDVRRSAGRDRSRTALAVAASVLVVGLVATGAWALRPDGRTPGPASPDPSAPTSTPPPTTGPDPILDPDQPNPSGLVVRRPDGDLVLPADTSCWTEDTECRRALMGDEPGPDLGVGDAVMFWFARPGWDFEAVFRPVGEVCPRATTVRAEALGGQWFLLPVADRAGTYEVSLRGRAPGGGLTETRFTRTTTVDGPTDDPSGTAWLFPDPDTGTVSVELTLNDLGVHPTVPELSTRAEVRTTTDGGPVRTMEVPLVPQSLECGRRGERGSFYFQATDLPLGSGEDRIDRDARSIEVVARFELGGTSYVGRGTWPPVSGEPTEDTDLRVPLRFTPALP